MHSTELTLTFYYRRMFVVGIRYLLYLLFLDLFVNTQHALLCDVVGVRGSASIAIVIIAVIVTHNNCVDPRFVAHSNRIQCDLH